MALTFNTNYMNNFPQAALTSVQRALCTWSAALDSPVPVGIWFIWDVVLPPNLSAMCIPNPIDNFPNAPMNNCWYPGSLADKFAGVNTKPGEPDMTIFFGNAKWYIGTGNPGPDEFDLESVALHELGHGFGFVSTFYADNNWPIQGNYGDPALVAQVNAAVAGTGEQLGFVLPALNNQPSVYGLHIQDAAGAQLTNPESYPNPPSQTLGGALTSYNLFYDLNRYPVYAPKPYEPFSSIDHLTDPNSLMRPGIDTGVRVRAIDAPVLTILNSLGW
jgi:hypothetical protein